MKLVSISGQNSWLRKVKGGGKLREGVVIILLLRNVSQIDVRKNKVKGNLINRKSF